MGHGVTDSMAGGRGNSYAPVPTYSVIPRAFQIFNDSGTDKLAGPETDVWALSCLGGAGGPVDNQANMWRHIYRNARSIKTEATAAPVISMDLVNSQIKYEGPVYENE